MFYTGEGLDAIANATVTKTSAEGMVVMELIIMREVLKTDSNLQLCSLMAGWRKFC